MSRLSDCFVSFFVFLAWNQATFGKTCEPNSMRGETCSQNETCTAQGLCICKPGFTIVNSTCQNATKDVLGALPVTRPSTPESSSGHIAAGIFIPLFIISIVIIGVFLNRKYRLVNWVRNKINQRNRSYDEVMIGQDLDDDDPPLG